MPFKILAFGLSDKGLVRENNEDVWGEVPEIGFYALADGMGGHQAGEVAAREAVSTVCMRMKKVMNKNPRPSSEEMKTFLQHAIEEANSVVYQMGSSHGHLMGMGTTICCIIFIENEIIYAHVGDSRIYRVRSNTIDLLTSDHSLLKELLDLGQVGQYQVAEFLYKNILTRAIGTEPSVEPSIALDRVLDDDVYLLCSDGLSDMLPQEDIEVILEKAPNVKEAAYELIQKAKDKGGYDNITTVVIQVQKDVHQTKKI